MTCPPCVIATEAAKAITEGLVASGVDGWASHEGICQGHGCECECLTAEVEAAASTKRVRALHRPHPSLPDTCWQCDHKYPCPTLRALDPPRPRPAEPTDDYLTARRALNHRVDTPDA